MTSSVGEHAAERLHDAVGASRPSPMCRSISSADSSRAVGLAMFFPAMSGALPCTASNTPMSVPEVRRGDHAETADQACAQIRHDVAVQIRQQQHVELRPGSSPDACRRRRRCFRRTRCRGYARATSRTHVEEQPVADLHDVRLVDRRDLLAAVARARARTRSCAMRVEASLGDDLQALDDTRDDFVLEAGIQILGVLADDHEVDAREARGHAGMFQTGRRFA